MRVDTFFTQTLAFFALWSTVCAQRWDPLASEPLKDHGKIKPKVFIISMFKPEASIWHGIPEFDILARNITVFGFSPLFPEAYCTESGEICQMITGESEINAAVSVSSLVASSLFDLTDTYFLIAGIAGVSPKVATLGSVTFARYAVQVALQYEFDAREIPSNWSTGYVPQGADVPGSYPESIYGTEVFEVNEPLRQLAIKWASTATLNDSSTAVAYRAKYANISEYQAATQAPNVVACDVATSDVYYSGNMLAEAFENTTALFTNGSATYCTTAQEDNATLEALLRGAMHKLVDFNRIIVMRTASDFDRPPPGETATYHLLHAEQGGSSPAFKNIYLAGVKIVVGILDAWNDTFSQGVKATNYVGDIFGSLGGEPDFGPGSVFNVTGNSVVSRSVRGQKERKMR